MGVAGEQLQERVLSPAYRRLTLGLVAVILLIAFEAIAVGTVMPVAVKDLDGLRWYAWPFTGYLVTSLWAMVWSGEESDRRGPGRPLLAGVAFFTIGLVVAGTAPNMGIFVLGRALQGLGGGSIIVAVYVVIGRAYPEPLRPRVFSMTSGAWVLPSIIGPGIAGLVADHLTWRLVFLGVPILVLPAVVMILPGLRQADALQTETEPRAGRRRLALLAAIGVALLQWGGQRLGAPGLVGAVIALALLAASVPRLLPSGTFRFGRGIPSAVLLRGLIAGGFFGVEAFIPLMLINERGLSTALAGFSLTGAALGWAFGSWLQGHPRMHSSRVRLAQIGCFLVSASLLAMCLVLVPSVPPWAAAVIWTVSGFGMGVVIPTFSLVVLSLSAVDEQGTNSAGLQVSDALFSTICIGLGGVIFAVGHTTAGHDAGVFVAIYAVMAAVVAVAVIAAPRLAVRR